MGQPAPAEPNDSATITLVPVNRVLHILPHQGGGGEIYVSMLESTPGFSHERIYLSAGRTPSSAARSLPIQLPRLARKVRVTDILHVHGDAAAIISSPALRARPSVITTHGLHLMRRSTGITIPGVRLGLRWAVGVSKCVIATSEGELKELASIVSTIDQSKLRIIRNGVRLALPVSEDERHQIRAAIGVGPDTVLGVFAGELEQRKEPLLAVAAAIRVREAGIPFVLALAGDGPLAKAVRTRAGDAVRALGFRDDLQSLLAAADMFLQPSSREGMSLALLEAMSHGLAIVAADSPGNAEAVANAGVMFSAGEEAGLANSIMLLVTQPELRMTLGTLAKRRAMTSFAADRFIAETTSVYSLVADSYSPATRSA